jgi:methyltransferase
MLASMLDSRTLFLLLLGLLIVERLIELVVSERHQARLLARGGRVVADAPYKWMVLFHSLWLIAMPLEVFLLERPFRSWLGWPALGLCALAMALRYWVIATLGDRWTTRIVVVPGEPPRLGGPYRFLRHPNYLAVVFEIVFFPLIHGAFLSALVGSLLNFWVLAVRIRAEEAALETAAPYRAAFAERRDRV